MLEVSLQVWSLPCSGFSSQKLAHTTQATRAGSATAPKGSRPGPALGCTPSTKLGRLNLLSRGSHSHTCVGENPKQPPSAPLTMSLQAPQRLPNSIPQAFPTLPKCLSGVQPGGDGEGLRGMRVFLADQQLGGKGEAVPSAI
ncbi:hypothetical protein WJX73_008327 [Symbiochloris irregularis]|uniref:Uncharacterized protein n=1 Tax=Symbiochloris irregularis TaxID=706552 RepID=A0AAW1NZ06_9CHLO